MSNLGYQAQLIGSNTFANGDPLPFTHVIINDDPNISYNARTFTFAGAGDYYISWFFTLKTGLGTSGPTISLVANGSEDQTYPSTNSTKTGVVTGSAILKANAGTTFQLVNQTGNSIVLATNVEVTANITIVCIRPDSNGLELQLLSKPGGSIAGGDIIPFDTVVEAYNDKITNDAGVISFITPGKYLVDWSVSLDGSSDATSISFQLKNPEKATEVLPKSESPVVIPNTFSGTALIQIFDATETTPFKLQLNNSSKNLANADSELTLSDIGIQATIRIVEL